MANYFVILGILLLSALASYWLAKNASRLDVPNERSSHARPTPTSGGLAILLAFSCYLVFRQAVAPEPAIPLLLGGAWIIAGTGYWDDRHGVHPGWRLLLHLMLMAVLVGALRVLYGLPSLGLLAKDSIWLAAFYVVALVWLLNLFNFMDGIDGLAALEAIFVCGGAAIIVLLLDAQSGWLAVLIALAAAVIGFVIFNWPPAKIFMGDTGSGLLGFLLAALILLTASESLSPGLNPWTWAILLAVFVADASVTLWRRLLRGQRVYQAHRSHTYQILARRWCSHRRVTLSALALNIFWLWPLAYAASVSSYEVLLTLGAYLPLVGIAVWVGAGTTNE